MAVKRSAASSLPTHAKNGIANTHDAKKVRMSVGRAFTARGGIVLRVMGASGLHEDPHSQEARGFELVHHELGEIRPADLRHEPDGQCRAGADGTGRPSIRQARWLHDRPLEPALFDEAFLFDSVPGRLRV